MRNIFYKKTKRRVSNAQYTQGFTPTPNLALRDSVFFTPTQWFLLLRKRMNLLKGLKSRKNTMPGLVSGFTLVEMIVALSIFTIALFISTNALLSVVNADRKSRGTRIATDNLNLTLEDISRKIRTGYSYACGGNPGVADCAIPQSVLAFTDQNNIRTIYKRGVGGGAIVLGVGASGCGAPYVAGQGCILRSDGGAAFVPGTSSEIDITNLNFFVSGSAVWPDTKQPAVIMSIDGSLGTQPLTKISFKIQTSATQRVYDR